MLVSGGQPLRLTTVTASDESPAWSPDGAQIAFLRGDAVLLVSPLGGAETKVIDSHCRDLAWTPDGKSLVVTDRNSPQEPCSIYLVSLATRERRRLTTPPENS